jgi:hypothetical protein
MTGVDNRLAVVEDGARELSGGTDDADDLRGGRQCESGQLKNEDEQRNLLRGIEEPHCSYSGSPSVLADVGASGTICPMTAVAGPEPRWEAGV